MRRALLLTLLSLTLAHAPVRAQDDARRPPPAEQLDDEADRFKQGRRRGAILLWAGMAVATVIIGVVRARQRR